MAQMVLDITGAKSGMIYQHHLEDGPFRRRPGIARVRVFLDWSLKFALDEGMGKTVE